MKTLSIVLALLTIATCAKADRILIYNGSDVRLVNATDIGRTRYFVIFDLDTLEYVSIEYGGSVPSQYYYSVNPEAAFVSSPIISGTTSTGVTKTQSYFAFGSNTLSGGFAQNNFGFFAGANSLLALGGSFSGDYPAQLIHTDYALSGDATTSTGVAIVVSGEYLLDGPLTKESNNGGFNLSAATNLITGALTASGYTQE